MKLPVTSIRLRLMLMALIGTVIAIGLSGLALVALFERHVERRLNHELDSYSLQLAAAVEINPDGTSYLRGEPSDPRFQRPLSGLYWQITDLASQKTLRSRSLWDSSLVGHAEPLIGGQTSLTMADGPADESILLHERSIIISRDDADRRIQILVAVDRAELVSLREGFTYDLIPGLAALAGLILLGAFIQIRSGLRPLEPVRAGIHAIRSGQATRLDMRVPREIAPLVEEVDTLIAAQEMQVARARDRAADLAHGLRTPLTALASDAARLRKKGQDAIADDIEALSQQMRRTVERELARARVRHGLTAVQPVSLQPVANAVIRTLTRTPRGEMIAFDNRVEAHLTITMQADDLAEILGNVLENATRAAKNNIVVEASQNTTETVIRIADDGPGLAAEKVDALSKRGSRQDESGGAGLGLAIVKDILDAYEGRVEFSASKIGGLQVTLSIPSHRKRPFMP
ncbi:sensor histidine kinase [Limoniibacter endophyticus]|uniref:histidine kinase n=1 Tax=Limoniibacter endophyticus TaxID=1565040 RepID=A0A8J3DKJ6_9HYPH|nr:HAMP domain-containing sensor histidine kinase [Limoniibacter endophyticus]GHC77935.1 histidine kinase [Limoniibacter endophyticus]